MCVWNIDFQFQSVRPVELHSAELGTCDNDAVNSNIDSKIDIVGGDITKLEVDAIVNAANTTLLGGGASAGPCSTCGACGVSKGEPRHRAARFRSGDPQRILGAKNQQANARR